MFALNWRLFKNAECFKKLMANGLAVVTDCLLNIGPKVDCKITKMIIRANSKSSFPICMLILIQGS